MSKSLFFQQKIIMNNNNRLTYREIAAFRWLRSGNLCDFSTGLQHINQQFFFNFIITLQALSTLYIPQDIIDREFKVHIPSCGGDKLITTALSMAICSGYDNIVDFILNLNTCTPTPIDLFIVLEVGTAAMLKKIGNKCPELIYHKFNDMGTAAMVLARNVKMSRMYNIQAANVANQAANANDDDDTIQLYRNNCIREKFRYLKNCGLPLHDIDIGTGESVLSMLIYAKCPINIILEVLKDMTYVQMNYSDDRGNTPVIEAISSRRTYLVKVLLESGCEPDYMTYKGIRPIDSILTHVIVSAWARPLDQIDMITYFNSRNITIMSTDLLQLNYTYVNFYVVKAMRDSGCRMMVSGNYKTILAMEKHDEKKNLMTNIYNYIHNPLSLQHLARTSLMRALPRNKPIEESLLNAGGVSLPATLKEFVCFEPDREIVNRYGSLILNELLPYWTNYYEMFEDPDETDFGFDLWTILLNAGENGESGEIALHNKYP